MKKLQFLFRRGILWLSEEAFWNDSGHIFFIKDILLSKFFSRSDCSSRKKQAVYGYKKSRLLGFHSGEFGCL
jgi:hypothetical protein